ncbi:MAG: rhomboid family intramembrane serine protease, partial [Acidobacteria bacterium]|nr:rhomboid family intramembrane serine protease [Acidobacteriota bacterium]
WRILTGTTLHGGILHILFNSYAFYSFGRLFEMLTNRAHLAIVFLLSCLGGGVLSLILQPKGVSVGASGGIVGLIGYLAVYAFVRRDFISSQFRRSLLINIAFIIFYGVVLMSNIDNWAHIGGLITGAIYAFIQLPRDPYADPRIASRTTETLGLLAVGAYGAICLFSILLILRVV